jgi:hypothetical protein
LCTEATLDGITLTPPYAKLEWSMDGPRITLPITLTSELGTAQGLLTAMDKWDCWNVILDIDGRTSMTRRLDDEGHPASTISLLRPTLRESAGLSV